jgi:predicted HicB family RNase H-like nuclease
MASKNTKDYIRTTLRIPKMIHKSLKEEAARRGTTFNSLCCFKLSDDTKLQD